MLSTLNAADCAGAQAEFGRFVHAGGRVLQGLVRRRAAEADLFGSHAASGTTAGAPGSSTGAPGNLVGEDGGGGNGRRSARATNISGGSGTDHTVRRGDTLWAVARQTGVSLRALIAANPQIENPNLIIPGQTVHLPGARPGGSVVPGSTAQPVGPIVPGDTASDAAAIARRCLHRNASELQRSGDLPMDASVASNICCARVGH